MPGTILILKVNSLRCFAVLFEPGYHWFLNTFGIHMSTFGGYTFYYLGLHYNVCRRKKKY